MSAPRYKPRRHYRTRRSSRERVAIDPSRDLGATALDRPLVHVPAIAPPRTASARPPEEPPRLPVSLAWWVALVLLGCLLSGALFGAALALLG